MTAADLLNEKSIPLKRDRRFRKGERYGRDGNGYTEEWTFSPPFVVNPRGILTHRVRYVRSLFWGDKLSHHHADYLCGNGCNIDVDDIAEVLVSDPPADRLLCARCEAMAAREDLPSGDALARRHVHRGILVAQRICCRPTDTPPATDREGR